LFVFVLYITLISDKTFTPYAKKKFRKETLRKMMIGAKIFFWIITISFFIKLVVPLLGDTITLAQQGASWSNIPHIEGKVAVHKGPARFCGSLMKSIQFTDSDDFYHLWMSFTLVRNGKYYEIYYLPRSHIVLKIKPLSEDGKIAKGKSGAKGF
jgi:hypothetical protein